MAAQFCMTCGKPLAPGANFCASCGSTVPSVGAAPPGPASPPPPPPPGLASAPPPGDAVGLGAALNVQGRRSFLLQHQLATAGRNYRVLDADKRPLFTARENLGQEFRANLFQGGGAGSGLLGSLGVGTRTFPWTILDATGAARASITIRMTGFTAVSTLADGAGAPVVTVSVDRGLAGGMTATASAPDGRLLLQAKGNLIRHNFSILDAGGREVAKIHEAWASVRDTYNLDLTGNVDPLYVLVFAILIDREKDK